MPTTGLDQDSLACRAARLPATTPDQCAGAGPWGADFQDAKFCGDDVCKAICRAMSKKCDDVQASIGDCIGFCQSFHGAVPARQCMEAKTLQAYVIGATSSDITNACVAFKACQ
jgi:hypothetical protein